MKSIIAIAAILSLLLTLTPVAQGQSIPVSIETRAVFTRSAVSLGEQWNGTHDRTMPELVVTGLLDRNWRLRYSLVPSYRFESSVLNAHSFVVNGIQFRETQQSAANAAQTAKEQKPIALSWHHQTTNRLDLMPLVNSPIRPVVAAQWVSASLTATGERDGKTVEAEETWRSMLWAVGGYVRTQGDRGAVEIQVVAGDRLTRAEALIFWWVQPGVSLTGGYAWEKWKIGELTVDRRGPWVGVRGEW